MIFVDSNVPMYLIGADHRHKTDAHILLERLATARERLVTSAEVFQESLHRFVALKRYDLVQPSFDLLSALVDEVVPVTFDDVDDAKDIVASRPALSARDALHVAVMRRHGITQILSFDRGFDEVPGIERIG